MDKKILSGKMNAIFYANKVFCMQKLSLAQQI